MLLRLLKETFLRRKKRVALALLAVLLGAGLASALLTAYGDVDSKMSRELRSYGSNILVRPESKTVQVEVGGVSYTPPGARVLLDERDVPKIKTIFWKNNITGLVPSLSALVTVDDKPVALTGTWFSKEVEVPSLAPRQFGSKSASAGIGGIFVTGIKATSPWWQVTGEWVRDGDGEGAMVGASAARRLGLVLGDRFAADYRGRAQSLQVVGIVKTGGLEEDQVFVSLSVAQGLLGVSYGVDKVLVGAMVTPRDKVSPQIRGKDPGQMTPQEYELWYCTPLIESVSLQIEEVVSGGKASPIRQVAEAEASFLGKTRDLMWLVTALALLASALGVMATMTTMVMERRGEIGLMKAIGANGPQIASFFFLEAGVIGAIGGLAGYGVGLAAAQFIGRGVFGAPFSFSMAALPWTLVLSVAVALVGSVAPVVRGTRMDPIVLLRKG